MVVNSLKAYTKDAVVLVYRPPEGPGTQGEIKSCEASSIRRVLASYEHPGQFISVLKELKAKISKQKREARYAQAFRKQHADFLRRFERVQKLLSQRIRSDSNG